MRPSTQVVHRPSLARGRVVFTALFGVLLTFGLAAPVVASGEPPVALDQSETTLVSTPVDIFLQATDNEDDILTFVIVGNPSHGTIGGPDCADAAVCRYTPTSGYVGGDSFTWKANDGTSDSNVATVTITVTPLTSHKILSAGPLTRIEITNDLNCAVDHTGDSAPEFYGDTACGSLVAVGGTLYGPADIPAGESASPRTPFTPVSQTGVLGSGTVGDPYRIVTVVAIGTTGLQLTETDAYVVGQETYRTDVQIASSAGTPLDAILYRAGDCYLQNSDRGFGAADGATGAVSCVAGVDDGTGNFVPGTRIEQWYPLSAGSSYYESFYSSVWAKIGSRTPFANSCEQCSIYTDNGAGLSWNVTIPAGGSVTRSHLTVFSPLGIVPLTTTKTVALPSVTAGRSDSYTITIANPNTSPATLASITDTLPAGFTYTPGSTSGATTTDPGVAGQVLTWTGPFIVPASGTITLTFAVTVSTTPGTYTNQAGGVGQSPYVVVGTGQTAPVTVVAAAHLTLTKQVSGGTALPGAWTLAASGPTPISGHSGDPAITNAAVDAGTYTLAESGGPTGYSAGAWGCTGGSLTGSSLTLAAGETASCSITNTFIPPAAAHLTLTKQVSGGTALPGAWTLAASGPTPISGHSGDPAITNAAVDAGTYTLAESGGPTGYSAGAWGCTGGSLTGSSLTLAAGETASCSITNTFIPPAAAHLTLTKQVSGGTALPGAWTLAASGPTPISGHSGDPAITNAAVDAGTYTLAESGGPTGYSAGAWGCTGGSLTGSSLTLAAGETASCSITNTFIPPAAAHLTLTKQVSGGTALPGAWTLAASGPTPISGHSGDPAITNAAVDAGTYTLAESGGPTGYSAGAWGCTGGSLTGSSLTLAAGETASCSITNTFIPPAAAHLTLTKQVSGGTALPGAWTLAASGPTPISGHSGDPAITNAAVDAGTYTLAESGGPTGYSAGAWGCTGGSLTGSSLTLAAGETASCSITNTFIPPAAAHLTLTKQVSGGTALPGAWTLAASGPTPISGHSGDPAITNAAVDAGTYTLAESGGPTGYSAGAWGCTGGSLTGSSLTLAAGETASCSITNTFIPPAAAHLTLTKQVSGGTALPGAWTLAASGPTPISGHSGDPAITNAAVDAGTYTLAESGGPTGYSAGAWGCTGGSLTGSSLTLAAGETASCSITNTFIPPAAAHLTLTKQVSGGTALPGAWTLAASGPTPISGHSGDPAITNAAVDAGTYTLAESGGPTGYSAGAWGCTGGSLTGSSLTLAAGETASCSITNTFIPPAAAHLTLTKQVSGGTALPGAWTLAASGPTPISGHSGDPAITNAAVDAGTYTLAESGGPTGYSAGAWGCTGGSLTGSSLTLAAGETASCSITNTFIPPAAAHLTLTKQVSGGTALPGAWTLAASGPTPISGHSGDPAITNAAVDAGTYTLAESGGPTGYSAGAWGCTGGSLTGSSLTLAAGETASCSITNTYSAYLPQGAFVIGDDGADVGATVTWWSPQWARENPLTGDPAPASFKGFAAILNPSPPVVGGTWTTSPGASAKPPKAVPAYMAVIVTSSVTKDGSAISGDIVRIVLVKTGSVFGTGTIVAVLGQ